MLDIDDTDDPAHGQQELALFNAHVGATCFQPIKIFEATSGKPVLSLIRPGKRPSGKEVAHILRHVIASIRMHWPKVEILVRGDSHYCGEPVIALLKAMHCNYILGLAINSRLAALAEPWKQQCDRHRSKWTPKVRRFHQFRYAADRSSMRCDCASSARVITTGRRISFGRWERTVGWV